MKFEEVLPKLRRGATARRAPWMPDRIVDIAEDGHVVLSTPADNFYLTREDVLANDWEIVKEPPLRVICDGGVWGRERVPCENKIVFECGCRRCQRGGPEERFHACIEHRQAVGERHARIYDRSVSWVTIG